MQLKLFAAVTAIVSLATAVAIPDKSPQETADNSGVLHHDKRYIWDGMWDDTRNLQGDKAGNATAMCNIIQGPPAMRQWQIKGSRTWVNNWRINNPDGPDLQHHLKEIMEGRCQAIDVWVKEWDGTNSRLDFKDHDQDGFEFMVTGRSNLHRVQNIERCLIGLVSREFGATVHCKGLPARGPGIVWW